MYAGTWSTEAHACALICVGALPEAIGVNAAGALSQTYPELSMFQSRYSCIAMANSEIMFISF